MKRIMPVVLAAAAAACVSSSAHAMKVAIKVGATYSNLGGDDVATVAPNLDYTLGLTGGVVLSPTGNFGVEIAYAQKGAEEDLGGGVMYYLEGDYAQATFLARVGSPSAKLVLGGYAGFKLGKVKEVWEGGGMTITDDSIDANIKDFDYGLVGGLSFGARQATFDVRYELGLASLDDSGSDLDITNEVITAGVTIRF